MNETAHAINWLASIIAGAGGAIAIGLVSIAVAIEKQRKP